jgi:hypothetical protein
MPECPNTTSKGLKPRESWKASFTAKSSMQMPSSLYFWLSKQNGEIEHDNLKQSQDKMKHWYENKVIVVLLIQCPSLEAKYCSTYYNILIKVFSQTHFSLKRDLPRRVQNKCKGLKPRDSWKASLTPPVFLSPFHLGILRLILLSRL